MPEKGKSEISSTDVVKKPQPQEDVPMVPEEIAVVPAEEMGDDEICICIKEDDLPDAVLKAVLYGFAEEQSSLKSLRKDKQKDGKDTSHISLKRGTILKYMSETLLQKQTLSANIGVLDLRGPKFREVFKMFLGIISDTFDEVKIPAEYKDMFFHALSKNLDGWEDRAEKIVKTIGNA